MKKYFKPFMLVMLLFVLVLSACASGEDVVSEETSGEEVAEDVTLRVLIHQNPPMVEFVEAFNDAFMERHPNVTVDLSVVNANDLSTVTQTRLTANDVDVIDMFAFTNAAEPYMVNVEPPNWQTLIEAGYLLDLTGQPFIDNYFESAIADAGTYDGKVYQVNLGTVSYSGIYYNKDLFTEYGVEVPTTWDGLVTACETFAAADIPCMTAGGKDGWPIFVGAYGLIGSIYPDQAALVEGLWTGGIKWNDDTAMEMWDKMKVYAQDMMEEGASGIAGDAAPGRFASGAVAMFPGGTWYASAIEDLEPAFEWGYIPFPGSDDPENNKYLFGKYDQGWVINANSPNTETGLLYLEEFSDPANYEGFVNAVGFFPTQPGVTLNTQIGAEVAPYLANFRVGFEQYWVAPKGAGQYANPWASYFQPFGTYDDAQELADKAQEDLQSGLDANQ